MEVVASSDRRKPLNVLCPLAAKSLLTFRHNQCLCLSYNAALVGRPVRHAGVSCGGHAFSPYAQLPDRTAPALGSCFSDGPTFPYAPLRRLRPRIATLRSQSAAAVAGPLSCVGKGNGFRVGSLSTGYLRSAGPCSLFSCAAPDGSPSLISQPLPEIYGVQLRPPASQPAGYAPIPGGLMWPDTPSIPRFHGPGAS
jgi:hypothetical protein